ncbi:MAG TPA: MFS transporter [Candidatus Nanopelagicaceae bacterium]|nr:MFS transporter [Candidatus Nanopelagicaceae bacterium]
MTLSDKPNLAIRRRLQLTSFVTTFDRFTMPPMLIAISHGLHVPFLQVAGAASAYFLIYGLMQPIWGIASNRIGLAATIRWCTLVGSIVTISGGLSRNITMLVLARVISGVCFSATFPAALIYVGETATTRLRHQEVTHLMTGVALGTGLSTAISGALTAFAGWRWGFFFAGTVGAVSAIYIWRLAELPRVPFREPIIAPVLSSLRNRSVLLLLALALIEGAAILGALTFIPSAVETTGRNAAVSAGVTATYGAAVLVGSGAVGRFAQRFSRAMFIFWGALLGATACALIALTRNLSIVVFACALLGLSWSSMHSSLQTWATEVLPAKRAVVVSFFAGSLFAGSALAAAVGGPLAQHHAYGALFIRGTALLLVVGIVGSVARTRWERRE